ncbi:MAG: rRNA pseudouridine synthase [Burkholderiales bacterium]|nr:rRNA pseudouridine synthase [Burkholderiales bacterium]
MAERGMCSRREADELIAQGLVQVDGRVVDQLGTRIRVDAIIELKTRARTQLDARVTILLNKPVGYVSGQPEDDHEPAVVLIRRETQERAPGDPSFSPVHLKGLAPAGRLDIDSQGLLVFTQNGTVAKKLIGEDSQVEKEYIVRVQGRLGEEDLKRLNHGLALDGRPLKPARVEWINQDQLRFVLKEGRKRQIRRMCEAVGLRVAGLKRVRVGRVRLGNLPEGRWRFLRRDEAF